jgi:hypothetical protein
MRRYLAAPALAFLAGCTSSYPSLPVIPTIPMVPQLTTGSIGSVTSRLVIYRTAAPGRADYIVNGRSVGDSQPNGFVVCELPAGRHEVAVGTMPQNAQLFSSGSQTIEVDLQPGSTTYLYAQPQRGLTMGLVTLSEVTESQGRAETAKLRKLESRCSTA